MRGYDIKELRSFLGMTTSQLAQLCGVHTASVYRWEAAGIREPRIDPMQRAILFALFAECQRRRDRQSQRGFGRAVLQGLLVGGTLLGLAILLDEVFPNRTNKNRRHG